MMVPSIKGHNNPQDKRIVGKLNMLLQNKNKNNEMKLTQLIKQISHFVGECYKLRKITSETNLNDKMGFFFLAKK